MVDAMNVVMGKHGVAGVGNHDSDAGLENMSTRFSECDFPWLLSNVRDSETHGPWSSVREFAVLDVPIPEPGTTVPPVPRVLSAEETRRMVAAASTEALLSLSPPPPAPGSSGPAVRHVPRTAAGDSGSGSQSDSPAVPGPPLPAEGGTSGKPAPSTPQRKAAPRAGGRPAGHVRVGVVCLAEYAWLETLTTVSLDQLEFEPPADCVRRLSPVLRDHLGCDFVVALAHMRLPNDRALAFEAQRHVDVVLGGHDHDLAFEMCGAVPVVKSGTEFWWLSEVVLDSGRMRTAAQAKEEVEAAAAACRRDFGAPTAPTVGPDAMQGGWAWGEGDVANPAVGVAVVPGLSPPSTATVSRLPGGVDRALKPHVSVRLFETRAVPALPEDPEALAIIAKWADAVEERLKEKLGETSAALDARFSEVRTRETNIGSILTDLMRDAVHADCALLNGGTIRANSIIGPGQFTMRDLVSLLPMQDPVVKLKVTGRQLVDALENGVSKWPALEGRFPQVSGIRFAFDPSLPPGERVLLSTVRVRGKPLLSTSEARHAKDSGVTGAAAPSDHSVSSSDTSASGISTGPRVTPPGAVMLRRTHSWVPPLGDEGRTPAAQQAALEAAERYRQQVEAAQAAHAEAAIAGEGGTPRPGAAAGFPAARGVAAPATWASAALAELREEPGTAAEGLLAGSLPAGEGDADSGPADETPSAPERPGWELKEFTLATKGYLATGRDGYTSLGEAEVLIDDENGPLLPALLRSHMVALRCLNGMDRAVHHSARRTALQVLRRFVRRRTRAAREADAAQAAQAAAAAVVPGAVTASGAGQHHIRVRARRGSVAVEKSRPDGMLPEVDGVRVPEGCTVPFVLVSKRGGRITIVGHPTAHTGVDDAADADDAGPDAASDADPGAAGDDESEAGGEDDDDERDSGDQ
ncbi:hypothetical protein FNF31_01212 [Cafeteria roenbergensis]|nr:hypothetical protein FNF31_01212 [Cafeteria roenbergensis]